MMYALTVWQPWASLIAIGAKPYEFRGWLPPAKNLHQELAIHAAARSVKIAEVRALIRGLQRHVGFTNPCLHREIALPFLEKVLLGLEEPGVEGSITLPLSHVLCTVELGQPQAGYTCAAEFGEDVGSDSDRPGTFNWGWPMLNPQPLIPPVSARGAQGLWKFGGA